MKPATAGWYFYVFLINFSQQSDLVPVEHFTCLSHDGFTPWGTTLKPSFLSCETSSFNEIKHLHSVRNLGQSGCSFNTIPSEGPMLIVAVCLLYTYVSHACHSLKSAAQHRDILIAMETISIYHASFDEGSSNRQGQDGVVHLPVHAQAATSTAWPAVFLQWLLWPCQHSSRQHNFALKIHSWSTSICVFKMAYIVFTFRRSYNYPFFKKLTCGIFHSFATFHKLLLQL